MKRQYNKWKNQGPHANEALIKRRRRKKKERKKEKKGEVMTVDSKAWHE